MANDVQFQSCIDACLQCATACNHCASSCLREQDVNMLARCIQTDMECTAFCYTAAKVMSINGDFSAQLCRLCADVCDACAAECEKHAQHGMEHCRKCAEACRQCAAECRKMQGAAA